MTLRFIEGDLDSDDVRALIADHVGGMSPHSPAWSIHALSADGLRVAEITFWSMRDGDALVGMGALKAIDDRHAEIKSMRTVEAFRGKGHGAAMLAHLIAEARRRGVARLSLETGAADFFAPARAMYRKAGFAECPPFEGYCEDRHSVFMTRQLVDL